MEKDVKGLIKGLTVKQRGETVTWYICPVNREHYCSKVFRVYCPVCSAFLVRL